MQVTEWVRVVFAHRNLLGTLAAIRESRKTGSLTVHFGQGGVTGLEWQQKQLDPTDWPFVSVNVSRSPKPMQEQMTRTA